VERRWNRSAVSLLRCRLETGRTHQIRVHLAAIGHPVVGDATYATGRRPAVAVPRLFLHATHLGFDHPVEDGRVEADSPLPIDLAEVLERLED
jgi:23S rRNA pseudouridine1911/1915/1917 synthase